MYTDEQFIELATSSASLDRSPKHNWVEDAGGLPPYVRKLARAISKKGGHDLSSAIAIAISRVKVWAAGGGNVDADTKAKAVKALAQWEAAKAKSKVKLTADDGTEYLMLAADGSYNIEIVRAAWDSIERENRRNYDSTHTAPSGPGGLVESDYPYRWICETGNDYIIVESSNPHGRQTYKLKYSVDSDDNVHFYNEHRVYQVWVDDDEEEGYELSLSAQRDIDLTVLTLGKPRSRAEAVQAIQRAIAKK